MRIPPFFEYLFRTDHKLASFVNYSVSKIEGHINANGMVFFPEYTDHGIEHLELVLQSSLDLATPAARGILTPGDAAAVITAVGLHDLGMFLTRDGFETLLADNNIWKGVKFFDQKSWSELWDEFYSEATRFDGRKLRLLLGDNYRPVRPLPAKGQQWEDFDYLLVGEFLRRHHPRLAHEIALYGLPSKDGGAISICQNQTEDDYFLADVAGLIARSHGMHLRTCIDYLDQKYQNRINPRRVHVVFLSILLRLADYFQIQSSRAPTERTEVVSFQSQLSEKEWRVHQAVKDIHNTSGDPEAIVVVAEPLDVFTYLKIKTWLTGVQEELDRSWAILGEVYGLQAHNNLNLLGLKIRRVKSNLDDEESFSRSVTYIPAQIAFEAANADLLKLLVGPLYSNNPAIGLRELIQNAVDAVREFEDSVLRHPELKKVNRYKQEADVLLFVKCDDELIPSEVVITDRGIGMTAEIVRNYFLKAGASFRRSNAWRLEHEDAEGRSRVFRTGRFGVGALAAFLLGNEIEVVTRHALANEDEGIKFSAKLDDEAISLQRITCPVGTQIKIKIPDDFRKKVKAIVPKKWEKSIHYNDEAGHYFLKKPSLVRHFSNVADLPVEHYLPQPTDNADVDWRCFTNPDFEKVFWSYSYKAPSLACNGIVIVPYDHSASTIWRFITIPNLSVFDKGGLLPVNLQRDGLQGKLPFLDDLLSSIIEDVVAHAIAEAPDQLSFWFDGRYEGFSHRNSQRTYFDDWSRWVISKDKFVLNESGIIEDFNPEFIVSIIGGPAGGLGLGDQLRLILPERVLIASYMPGIFHDNNVRIKGTFSDALRGRLSLPGVIFDTFTTYVPESLLSHIKTLRPGKQVRADLRHVLKSESIGDWRIVGTGDRQGWIEKILQTTTASEHSPCIVCISRVARYDSSAHNEIIKSKWNYLLKGKAIPLDLSSRKKIEKALSPKIGEIIKLRRQKIAEQKKASRRSPEL